jgi:cyclophilin family peptidyl-prolyl cis-trans isomerase/HEAT repeat protein
MGPTFKGLLQGLLFPDFVRIFLAIAILLATLTPPIGFAARAELADLRLRSVSLKSLPSRKNESRRPTQDSGQEAAPLRSIPIEIMLRIVSAEDERRWDNDLRALLDDTNASVRRRAALAAGRIGDEAAVPALSKLLGQENDQDVKEMAAFALGEIESAGGAPDLLKVMGNTSELARLRARAIESLGKIAASLPLEQEKQKLELHEAILAGLRSEAQSHSRANHQVILLGLTAALRARIATAGPTILEFLNHAEPRIRADAANALARLRLKEGEARLRELLTNDPDAIVRANAARALGAAEDKLAFDGLLDRALNDGDLRVRVSAVRALALLNNQQAAEPLLNRGITLARADLRNRPSEANEVLEIASTLGRILQGADHQQALTWLKKIRPGFGYAAPELEIAFARISPASYLEDLGSSLPAPRLAQRLLPVHWKAGASLAQGLAEIAASPATLKDRNLLVANAEVLVRAMLTYRTAGLTKKTLTAVHSEYAIPDMTRALAAFKPNDLAEILRNQLRAPDVIVRATAAELLGQLPPEETVGRALAEALAPALADEMNDAALAILDSLAKQKTIASNEAIKTALDSSDHLVRRRAVALWKTNGAGDFTSRIATVKTLHTTGDYRRALARIDKTTRATVTTSKGAFVIEFLPEDAPLTVDNFVRLAQKRYFNGQTIPRVVPNFVIQAGDPRGDQNGGPGYTIRCEINDVPYERAAVGMALSGKDTGGSQWFVTHSPQPHLDGGYTVFGRVVSGMDVVDRLVRGDLLRTVTITERPLTQRRK